MDQRISALLEDLDSRGLLAETLVVWMGDWQVLSLRRLRSQHFCFGPRLVGCQ